MTVKLDGLTEQSINRANALMFDFDGTLVDTDYANYLAYKNAIQKLFQLDGIPYNPNERFNRIALKKVMPNLTKEEYEKVIQLKNELYAEHLHETKLNKSVAEILKKYSKTHKTVLVTNCREDRAVATLKYHGLIDSFNHKFYQQIAANGNLVNKFQNALNSLQISPTSVIVFDNEKSEFNAAIFAGIPEENIISI